MVEQQSNHPTTAVATCQPEPASMNLVIENNHVAMSFTKFHGSNDHPQLTLILLSPQKEQHLCQKLMFQHGKLEKVLLAPFIKEAYGTKWSPNAIFSARTTVQNIIPNYLIQCSIHCLNNNSGLRSKRKHQNIVLKSFRFHVFYFLLKIKALKRGAVLSRLKELGGREELKGR